MKLIFLSFAVFFAMVGCGPKPDDGNDGNSIRLTPVRAVEIKESERYPVAEGFSGIVEARRKSNLAFELSGTVDEVFFDEGDFVKGGTVLASIDTSRLAARKEELGSTITQAEANLGLANATYTRDQRLKKSNAVSQAKVDQSREAYESANANLSRIRAQFSSVEVDIAKSQIIAPWDGTLSKRSIDEGAVVNLSQSAFEIVETGHLEIRVALAGSLVGKVKVGDELPIRISSSETIPMKILRVAPVKDAITRTVDVILEVPPTTNTLRDGDLVTLANQRYIDSKGFFLPRDGLTESARGLWACFVTVKDDSAGPDAFRLDRRDLELIQEYAEWVYVRGPLSEGEKVISGGLGKLANRLRVEITEVAPACNPALINP